MTERTVRRCGTAIRWQFRCPRTWDALAHTAESNVRHCSECDRDVHFCADDAETLAHARAGHCIAREEPSASELPARRLGQVVPVRTAAHDDAIARARRERGIREALRDIDGATRTCPTCGYPAAEYRASCYVCGTELGRA